MNLKKFDIRLIALIFFTSSLTAAFISFYCQLFDDLGSMAKQRLLDHPLLTFFTTPAILWLSAYLCRLCAPNAAGNHLQTALDHLKKNPTDFKKIYDFFNVRLVVIKAISSLTATFGGGSLGKEGPSMHMSAGIFVILLNRFSKVFPNVSLESWITVGSAVGLTTVFNAPLAGIAFACEKLLRFGRKNFKSGIILALICIAITITKST